MFLQYVPFCNLFEIVLFYQYIGAANASNSLDNIVTCPKERNKRELDRARRAALSPEQKAIITKRRRDLYAAKKCSKKTTNDSTREGEAKRDEEKL